MSAISYSAPSTDVQSDAAMQKLILLHAPHWIFADPIQSAPMTAPISAPIQSAVCADCHSSGFLGISYMSMVSLGKAEKLGAACSQEPAAEGAAPGEMRRHRCARRGGRRGCCEEPGNPAGAESVTEWAQEPRC